MTFPHPPGSTPQRLCARLDAVDFRLTAALASGRPWASLEVLRAHRIKLENLGRVNYALQSVTSTFQSFFYEEKEDKSQLKQEWKEHHFALHVYRKHIIESAISSPNAASRAAAEAALQEQQESSKWSDDEGDQSVTEAKTESDVPEIICDVVEQSTLSGLSGFVQYCDPLQTPPVLAAAMVQSLLLVEQTTRARALFEAVFVRSRKTQAMVVAGSIPVDFLSSVKMHRVASVVLRRLLARYESLSRADLCHLLDHMLLEDFREEKHCQDLVLNNDLVQDITVYCRVSTRAVAQFPRDDSDVFQGASEETELLRLRKVGERLFAAVFVLHGGFLPDQEDVNVTHVTATTVMSGVLWLCVLASSCLGDEAGEGFISHRHRSQKIAMSTAKSSWKRVKNQLLLSILLFLVTRKVLHSAWVNLWNTSPRSQQQNFRRRREIHQQRNAGFSVHSNLDLDISVPDSDLEAGVPWLLAVAGLLGLRQLKAAVDGPEEFHLQPGSLQGKNVLITGPPDLQIL
eukprot:symbB.v1.2.015422.t1/scaffold1151.1/size135147/1